MLGRINGSSTATNPPSCALSNNTLSVKVDSAPVSTILTINTTAPRDRIGSGLAANTASWQSDWGGSAGVALSALLLCFVPPLRRSWRALATLLGLAAGFTAISGCGGSGSPSNTPAPTSTPIGTTAGNYTVTINVSSSSTGIFAPPSITIPSPSIEETLRAAMYIPSRSDVTIPTALLEVETETLSRYRQFRCEEVTVRRY